ncbi:MAG: hypothetical protein NTW28_05405, partial [Candidatus Solibacter sp.]|nr:hypothetical protein [Candidatus Solibacter sp.]
MDLKVRFACLPLAISIFAIPGLSAENVNVSPIAISGRSLDWTEEANTFRSRPGATYTYYQMGRVRIQNDLS